ncbi:hypothetical protein NPIL_137521 [Nephila pilipes]|uniref:Uncharacterized protein n=1 Tax=Nephila pilipes TaxID=299642 RepID=A0A8X6U0K8_NEPPI|nr:hypothetical protein NPIL_137521 [Nephila pilipes]
MVENPKWIVGVDKVTLVDSKLVHFAFLTVLKEKNNLRLCQLQRKYTAEEAFNQWFFCPSTWWHHQKVVSDSSKG